INEKYPYYSSRKESYDLDPSKIFSVVNSILDYKIDEREKFNSERRGREDWIFRTDLDGKDRRLVLVTAVNLLYNGSFVKMKEIVEVVLDESGQKLTMTINALERLVDIDPEKLYAIGEKFSIKK
ncbi:MAG: hypothetical protein Q8L27_01310, partial [archaeon]|nr:hypothetical protein [archaeon]